MDIRVEEEKNQVFGPPCPTGVKALLWGAFATAICILSMDRFIEQYQAARGFGMIAAAVAKESSIYSFIAILNSILGLASLISKKKESYNVFLITITTPMYVYSFIRMLHEDSFYCFLAFVCGVAVCILIWLDIMETSRSYEELWPNG